MKPFVALKVISQLFAVALLLAGIGAAVLADGSRKAQDEANAVTVTIQVTTGYYGSISFNPGSVTISVGGRVTWQNSSSSPVALFGSQAGINTTIPSGGSFSFVFNTAGNFTVTAQASSASATMTVTVAAAGAPTEEVQEFALIHSLNALKIYSATLTVKKGVKVRLFNTATDGSHPTVAISSDEDGKSPVFGLQPFAVEVGKLTVVEFTPDREGTFFITHHLHGHGILGKLIVTSGQ